MGHSIIIKVIYIYMHLSVKRFILSTFRSTLAIDDLQTNRHKLKDSKFPF